MRTRKAFTLIELMVVIGMIVILMGILLPVLNHVRHSAQVMQQKADFQTITAALEHYRQDFGDYPRNTLLPKWNTKNIVNPAAPGCLTLCAALLGPGPAVTQLIGGNLEAGDGADGEGFRSQSVVTGVTQNGVGAGTNSVTVSGLFSLSGNPPYLTSIDLSVGLPNEEVIGVTTAVASAGGNTSTLTLAAPAQYTHAASVVGTPDSAVKTATGKVWPNYLDTNAFKAGFVESFPPYSGQPELLDRWGGVIQYFTRFGPNNNRFYDSTFTTPSGTTVSDGPLYGYSAPKSVDGTNGQNAIWDFRDGAPYVDNTGTIQSWQASSATVDLGMAVQWMLGTSTPQTILSNVPSYITPPDTLHFDGPFILISAGPAGPSRVNGGFCNLAGVPSNLYQTTFQTSGNIYNFDR